MAPAARGLSRTRRAGTSPPARDARGTPTGGSRRACGPRSSRAARRARPTSRLDALRSFLDLERTLVARLLAPLERLRLGKQPDGTGETGKQGPFSCLPSCFPGHARRPGVTRGKQENVAYFPASLRGLGAMLRHQAETVDGAVAEAGPQALDELRHGASAPSPVEREEVSGLRPRFEQRTAAQPYGAHWLGQPGTGQPLAQQGHDPRHARHRLRESQSQPRRRGIAVQEPQLERFDACAPVPQEFAQLVEQRLTGTPQAFGIGDLRLEVASRGEALGRPVAGTGVARHAARTVQLEAQPRLETARETVTRQAQAVAHAAHAHRRERLQRTLGPARDGKRQRRESGRQRIRPAERHFPPARANHSDASGVG